MLKLISTLLLCFFITQSFGQTERKVSIYFMTQYNKTLHDYTKGNNPWGIGVGIQAFLNGRSKLKPTVEVTSIIYLEDDKLLRYNPDGTFPKDGNDIGSMTNLFAGAAVQATKNLYLSFLGGPSFINNGTYLAIKPSMGFHFLQNQRMTAKLSYINVFNRRKGIDNGDFSTVSLAIGVKLY